MIEILCRTCFSRWLLPGFAAGVLVTGCTMAPDYERPASPVTGHWPAGVSGSPTNAAAADIRWPEFFGDPRLRQLIALSLEHNRDLRVAALRVEQTRAQYRIQRSALFPALDANALGSRARTPGTYTLSGDPITANAFDVNVGAAFELDLFGRVRSLKREALERYFASEETRRSVHIALVSEVASQYLTWLQLKESQALAEETLRAVEQSFELNRRSFAAGTASELDLRTAEAQVQTARVNVSTFDELRAQSENALALLIGRPLPQDVPAGYSLREQPLLMDLPEGVPSEVLLRRPDILAAEHILKAANANIGAARAAFFPRVLLTGSAGTASAKLSDLFTGPSFAWNFSPQITVPIFQGGRNRANLDVSALQKQIEIANYERAIQAGFREVADALVVRSRVGDRLAAQERLVAAQQKRFELTNARYRQGVDSYVTVLLAQQDLYAAQQNLLQFQAARLLNAVTLYRALGGGWKGPELRADLQSTEVSSRP
ncbi:MAG TPA: efflux transporter outer membrane subunit [Verrucomicrobiae bacterium]|nr:efflux transporter outer membrane subunit [Verrucomicrobiae bacterium]